MKTKQNASLLLSFSTLSLFALTTLSLLLLTSPSTSAVVTTTTVTIDESCTMTSITNSAHVATLLNGTYSGTDYTTGIGSTTLKTFCNDNAGYAIYAIGYTNNEYGNTKLHWNKASSLSDDTNDIETALYTQGTTINSTWSMKLASSGGTYATTIVNGTNNEENFTSWHEVPDEYTKVAYRTSGTDMEVNGSGEGSSITVTYDSYISAGQPAGAYNGKVKYALVHPSSQRKPVLHPAILDTGQTVNSKLKSLAATVINGEETTITPIFNPDDGDDLNYDANNGADGYIKSIIVHLETTTPSGFTPTTANTISSSTSDKPVYIIFDNTDDAGVIHFYTEGEQIVLSSDSSFMFYMLNSLTEVSDIADWDASNVTNMSYMFGYTGQDATTFTINLSSWDTSSVTDMGGMFRSAGSDASTWSIGDLSSWETTNVTDMHWMFSNAGYRATTWSIGDLSSWETTNVTDMSWMFSNAGYRATTWSIGDLSSWETSSVTNMSSVFEFAGYSATTWSIGDLSSWETTNVTDMSWMFCYTGYSATTWSIGDLSSWETTNVTNMRSMFERAGYSATTWSIGDLSSWDTSNVTNMRSMFEYTGYSATTYTLNLSSWNTSSVTDMYAIFRNAGHDATTWSITIPPTNGNNINNTTNRIYGQTTSVYSNSPSGKSFTLAQ